ncbi:formyltransferase family protein [Mesorhizobium amorphae]|uniref:formyltransferase family protein n=1 Tax=Mesorhizobium amorphae TaxID=71433 RepID=UPI001181FF4C
MAGLTDSKLFCVVRQMVGLMPPKQVLFLGYDRNETALIDAIERSVGGSVRHAYAGVSDLSEFDLVISFGYRHLLDAATLATAKRPPLNLHIAFLPWNKGAHPLFWACMDGTPIGVTIHEMDPGVDTGHILFQALVDISPSAMTFEEGYWRLRHEMELLFLRNLRTILAGDYHAAPQRHEGTFHRARDLPEGFSWSELISPAVWRLRESLVAHSLPDQMSLKVGKAGEYIGGSDAASGH